MADKNIPSSSLAALSAHHPKAPGPHVSSSSSSSGDLDSKLEEMVAKTIRTQLEKQLATLSKVAELDKSAKTTSKAHKPSAKKGLVSSLKQYYGGTSSSSELKDKPSADLDSDAEDPTEEPDVHVSTVSDTTGDKYAPVVLANAKTAGSVLNWVSPLRPATSVISGPGIPRT